MSRLPSPSLGLLSTARQLFSQPAVLVSVALLVLVATLGLSTLPRSLELASRQDLRETLTGAEVTVRNISISQEHVHRPVPGSDPLAQIRDRGARFEADEMPASVQAKILDRGMVVESPQFGVEQLPGTPDRSGAAVFIDFRMHDGLSELSRVTAGRLPAPAAPTSVQFECPLPEEDEEEEECPPTELPVFEVAMTEEMAVATRMGVGDRALLFPDRRDRAWEGVPTRELDAVMLVVELTGIIELDDPGLDVWFGDRKLHLPRQVFQDLDTQWIESTALISADTYGDMLRALGGSGPPWWRYEWRYFIDSDAVARTDLAEFSRDASLVRLANSAAEPGSGGLVLSTRLPELIDEHLAQRAQTLRIMALTVAGIIATVTFAVLALGVLMTERQREQVVLARDRGASGPQVTISRLYQALLMTVPAAVGAYAATRAVFDDTTGTTPYAIVLTLAVAAIVALVVPVLGLARRPLGSLRSESSWNQANSRRLVIEIALVFLAAASVILVRRRDPRAATDFDWLLVATPALVGSAVAALTIRLAGPLGSALAWLSARGRGAVSFLALRRSVRQSVAMRTPLAVLVVCMATASLSVTTMRSIEIGQEEGSWEAVGADFAVSNESPGIPLPPTLTPEVLGTDDVVFGALSSVRATFNQQRGTVALWAVEAASHEDIFGSTPGDLGLGVLQTPTTSGELAAVVSDTWPNRPRPAVGQIVTFSVGGTEVSVEVVAMRPSLPGVSTSFLAVDTEGLEGALGEPVPPTHALIRGPRSLESAVSEAASGNGAVVVSRYAELEQRTEDPMVRWTMQGLTAGWIMAAGVGALSIVAALALGSASRRRDLGFLKTMGLENRGATVMTLVEQVPGVALATALGLVTGAATLVAIRPSLDLSVLTGERTTPILIDWGLLGILFALALALLTAAGVIFVLVNRRQDLGRALRVGDE